MRRATILASVCFLLIAGLAGCATQDAAQHEPSTPDPPASGQGQPDVVWATTSEAQYDVSGGHNETGTAHVVLTRSTSAWEATIDLTIGDRTERGTASLDLATGEWGMMSVTGSESYLQRLHDPVQPMPAAMSKRHTAQLEWSPVELLPIGPQLWLDQPGNHTWKTWAIGVAIQEDAWHINASSICIARCTPAGPDHDTIYMDERRVTMSGAIGDLLPSTATITLEPTAFGYTLTRTNGTHSVPDTPLGSAPAKPATPTPAWCAPLPCESGSGEIPSYRVAYDVLLNSTEFRVWADDHPGWIIYSTGTYASRTLDEPLPGVYQQIWTFWMRTRGQPDDVFYLRGASDGQGHDIVGYERSSYEAFPWRNGSRAVPVEGYQDLHENIEAWLEFLGWNAEDLYGMQLLNGQDGRDGATPHPSLFLWLETPDGEKQHLEGDPVTGSLRYAE